jgi:tripartite-type tricarboxylate transporter receptor subunit TctC
MNKSHIRCLSVALALSLGLFLPQIQAADYPNKPVTIMVGWGAGGTADTGARILAESLKKVIGQPILIQNKPGAGTQVMLTYVVKKTKPDGYTMPLIQIPFIQTIVFDPERKPQFTTKDFQPVACHVRDPGAILVKKPGPYKTLEDLLNAAKARPGKVTISHAGIGSDDHLAILNIERETKVKFNVIILKNTKIGIARLLGGHIDAVADNTGGFLPTVTSGLGSMLAVMSEQRSPDLPNVPTFREKGFDVISSSTRGYAFKAGTPMDIVRYMAQSIKKAMEDPEHVARMKKQGAPLKFMGVEEFSKFYESSNERAKPLIKTYRK